MSKIIAANWKQNKTEQEVKSWLKDFGELIEGKTFNNVLIIIAPSYPYLSLVKDFAKDKDFVFCSSQDVSKNTGGRHTGEVSASQLADFADYCIVGHSETGETGEIVLQKGTLCLESKISPIICFVDHKNPPLLTDVTFAWEDPENITKEDGVYTPKSSDSVKEGLITIKEKLGSESVVLYGGSVNRQNADELSKISELDGVLIGSASLDPQHFFDIVSAFEK